MFNRLDVDKQTQQKIQSVLNEQGFYSRGKENERVPVREKAYEY